MNKKTLDAYGKSLKMMQEAKRYHDFKSNLKEGDTVIISGYYFEWVIKIGYSNLFKKDCVYASAQNGLIHNDLSDAIIMEINGIKINKP